MIAQTIQLSLAPVFVLVAIGQILNALSVRYGRVIDRSRAMQEMYEKTSGREHDIVAMEIRGLDRRIKLMSSAIRAMVLSGLAIGTTVALLFLDEIAGVGIYQVAAGVFLVAIALLMWALLLFLREIQVSAEMLRVPRKLLELGDE
jgi:hypothetical protein